MKKTTHPDEPHAYLLMGVSGCGKSTIGKLLAESIQAEFHDGDDYHPRGNVKKMSHNIPLNDEDRAVWLKVLKQLINKTLTQKQRPLVIACSALKKAYRQQLGSGSKAVTFIYLQGSFELIQARMLQRKNHYMPPGLLQSQFDILEEPARDEAITVSIQENPGDIVSRIIDAIRLQKKQ